MILYGLSSAETSDPFSNESNTPFAGCGKKPCKLWCSMRFPQLVAVPQSCVERGGNEDVHGRRGLPCASTQLKYGYPAYLDSVALSFIAAHPILPLLSIISLCCLYFSSAEMRHRIAFSSYILLLGHLYASAELLSDCPSSPPPPANASGSFSVRAFEPLGSSSSSPVWTFGTTISEDESISRQHILTQTFFVSTQPFVNVSSGDLPYTGGVVFVNELVRTVSSNTVHDPGDCSSIFDQECITALTKSANSTALSYSEKSNSSTLSLPALARSLPSECNPYVQKDNRWSIPIYTRMDSHIAFGSWITC
jgi:hypothetical protein